MREHYVYVHRTKGSGEIFYVGKGCGDRYASTQGRNANWRHIAMQGFIVEKIVVGIDEVDAKILEFACINELFHRGVMLTNNSLIVEKGPHRSTGVEFMGDRYYHWRNVATPVQAFLSVDRMVVEQGAIRDELDQVLDGHKFVTTDGWCINKPRGRRQ